MNDVCVNFVWMFSSSRVYRVISVLIGCHVESVVNIFVKDTKKALIYSLYTTRGIEERGRYNFNVLC
jgi:hypothetical protein